MEKEKRTYTVEVSELLSRCIEIEASSEKEALDAVRDKYRNGEIILDAEDFAHCNISILHS